MAKPNTYLPWKAPMSLTATEVDVFSIESPMITIAELDSEGFEGVVLPPLCCIPGGSRCCTPCGGPGQP